MANGVKGKTIISALLNQGPIAAGVAAGVLSVSGDAASPYYPGVAGTVATSSMNPWAVAQPVIAPRAARPWLSQPGNLELVLLGLVALILILE